MGILAKVVKFNAFKTQRMNQRLAATQEVFVQKKKKKTAESP